jgi:hypothetical protein
LFESVWSQIAKVMKEIRKTENEKELEQKKKRRAATGLTREPGQPSSHRTSPPAALSSPPFPLPFLYFIFTLTAGTHPSVSSSPTVTPHWKPTSPKIPPPSIPFTACIIRRLYHDLK